jgi:uncharacterized protein
MTDWKEKLVNLRNLLQDLEGILIAYSGGVDSGLLLLVAEEVLGEKVKAVMVDTEAVPRHDIEHAMEVAGELGVEFTVVKYSILEIHDFIENGPGRCYYCRKIMSQKLKEYADEKGIPVIATGVTVEDRGDYRPGIKAEEEAGFWHPLAEVEMTKEDVRSALGYFGAEWSDKAASPCLSSRVMYGDTITSEVLERIDRSEALLREMGYKNFRVRSHGNMARIEISREEVDKFLSEKDQWPEVVDKLKEFGFKFITLDLEGFYSGSMNRELDEEVRIKTQE